MSAPEPAVSLDVDPAAILTGTAKEGNIGPSVGLLDIGVSESAYLFRIAIPGILKVPHGLRCEVHHSGMVQIQAVMAGPEATKDAPSGNFRFITPPLNSPGPFMVSFNLPGPVDARLFTPIARRDGVLEVVVLKSKQPEAPAPAPAGPTTKTPK